MTAEIALVIGLVSLGLSAISFLLSTKIYRQLHAQDSVRTLISRQSGGFLASFRASRDDVYVKEHGIVWLDASGRAVSGDPLWPIENPVLPLQSVLLTRRGAALLPADPSQRVVETEAGRTLVAWFVTDTESGGLLGFTAIVWKLRAERATRPKLYTGNSARAWIPDYTEERPTLPRRIEGRGLGGRMTSFRTRGKARAAMTSSRFTRIDIEGLRGFGPKESISLAQPNGAIGSGLTIVVGANNSGKSTAIEAFDAIYRATRQSSVSFGADRRHASGGDFVSVHLYTDDGRSVGVESIRAGTSEATVSWNHGSSNQPTLPLELTAIPARRQFSAYFGRMGDGQRGWASTSGEYSRSQNRDGFVGRLFALHANEQRLRQFNALFEEVTGRAIRWAIDLGPQNQYFLRFTDEDGSSHTSDGLGDGLISLLFILDALHDSTPESLIVIDEPELSLHPQYVSRLGALLSRYAKDRQIVFATHSPTLINWEWVAAGALVARVFKVEGKSRVAQPSSETLQMIAVTHLTNRFNPHVFGPAGNEVFFQEDSLLVLEGQEDVIYLPAVLQSLGITLTANIFGWGAGGAGNISGLLRLFQELKFRSVAVLLDGDSGTKTIVKKLATEFPDYAIASHPAEDIRTKPANKAQTERKGLLKPDNKTVRVEFQNETISVFTTLRDYLERK